MSDSNSIQSYRNSNFQFQFPKSWTPGKYLRKQKQLRKSDPTAKQIEPDQKMSEYIQYLKQKGLFSPKLNVGLFRTRNNLPYIGLIASEKILTNECFLEIPKDELLTTKKAFFSKCQQIYEENPQFYHKSFHHSWEDNILWTFILYQYQIGSESPWYQMIQNLSKDIDYLIFWNEDDMKLLQDTHLIKIAKRNRKEYEIDQIHLQKILKKYPLIFNEDTFKNENCRWIYVHLVSRCFGNYFKYVTMVPFAEFLNHECSDVYYDFKYNEGNPKKKEESEYPDAVEKDEQEINEETTTEGSYNSDLADTDEDFDYFIEYQPLKEIKAPQLKIQHRQDIRYLSRDIEFFIFNNIDVGDSFSVFFAANVLDKIQNLEIYYLSEKQNYYSVKEELTSIQNICNLYKSEINKYYKVTLKKKTIKITQKQSRTYKKSLDLIEEEKLLDEVKIDKEKQYFNQKQEWEEDEFDHFVMKCSRHDQFEINSQVYFCYGRLSNRMLLMRYGISLEYNKYDHIYIKLEYISNLNQFNFIKEKLMSWKNISKFKKFKLKRTQFNIDLIFFLRAQTWKLDPINSKCIDSLFWIYDLENEVKVLQQAKQIYENCLEFMFNQSLEKNLEIISNPQTSYHEYFATVYRIERQRILIHHIKLCQIAIEIIKRVKDKGLTIDFGVYRIHDLETSEEEKINRIMLQQYLNRLLLNNNAVVMDQQTSQELQDIIIKNRKIQLEQNKQKLQEMEREQYEKYQELFFQEEEYEEQDENEVNNESQEIQTDENIKQNQENQEGDQNQEVEDSEQDNIEEQDNEQIKEDDLQEISKNNISNHRITKQFQIKTIQQNGKLEEFDETIENN